MATGLIQVQGTALGPGAAGGWSPCPLGTGGPQGLQPVTPQEQGPQHASAQLRGLSARVSHRLLFGFSRDAPRSSGASQSIPQRSGVSPGPGSAQSRAADRVSLPRWVTADRGARLAGRQSRANPQRPSTAVTRPAHLLRPPSSAKPGGRGQGGERSENASQAFADAAGASLQTVTANIPPQESPPGWLLLLEMLCPTTSA